MKKVYTIGIAILVFLLVLALAVFRGQMSRELILKKNGVPLANMQVELLPHTGSATVIRTSTDPNGRLDLSGLPRETEMIAVAWSDGTGSGFNGDLVLPASGSRTIDFRGDRTISTTKKNYVDFGVFQFTGQEVAEWSRNVAVPKQGTEPPPPVDSAQPATSHSSKPGH